MSVQYRGRTPDSDHSAGAKKYVTDTYVTTKVDNGYVNSSVAIKGATLVTFGYVDAADENLAQTAEVDAADVLYVPISSVGVADGVPSLDSNTYIPSSQLGTVQTSRMPVAGGIPTIFLTGERELLSINAKEYKVASLVIDDPGFPYMPLVFAMVQGGATNGVQAASDKGTGNYAQLSILNGDRRYGWMVTTGQKQQDFHQVVPYGGLSSVITPPVPTVGPLILDLWAGLYGGTTYTINPTGLVFHAIAYPAVT